MSGDNLKSKISALFWSFFPEETHIAYFHRKTFATMRHWHLRKYYSNDPDGFVRILDREYEKPRRLPDMPSFTAFIIGDEENDDFRKTYESVNAQACRAASVISLCGRSIAEADKKIRESGSEYIAILRSGNLLEKRAFYEGGKLLINGEKPGLIYSDEDTRKGDGTRIAPVFKPDYAPDLLMSMDYYGGFVFLSKKAYENAGGLKAGEEGDAFYDLWLRISENEKVSHVDRILFHRTENYKAPEPDAESVKRALARRGLKGNVSVLNDRCIIDHESEGLVSIVIPSKDNPAMLRDCLGSIDEQTLYRDYEIIIVDNGSSDENRVEIETLCEKYKAHYIYEKKDFNFSYMCNLGAKDAKGDVIVFLNDDIKITEPKWLGSMAGQARLPYSGAVGCLLIYPDNNMIQHAGTKDSEDGPNHIYQGYYLDDPEVFDAVYPNDVNGVTAACLAIRKEVFEKTGCFDENMSVCYNDVALCFDLINSGYVNCVRGDVCLIHKESVSRGSDEVSEVKYRRMLKEHEYLYDHHALKNSPHPFYNINQTYRHSDKKPDYSKWLYDVTTSVREMTADEISRWQQAPVREDYKICFDECDSFKCIHLFGWAYAENYTKNYTQRRKMVIYNDKHHYIAELGDWYRPDVYSLNMTKDTEYCGFRAKFDKKLIEEGTYSLCLWSGIGKKETENKLIR
ncbi:MAG: glycosyltransferase [Lachnospiraceae bacterium]|nr:glycosyltransferase [Lachnospiraceae bacterium]